MHQQSKQDQSREPCIDHRGNARGRAVRDRGGADGLTVGEQAHGLRARGADLDGEGVVLQCRLGGGRQARGNPDWMDHRRQILTLLEQRARLERMARIVGKDALPPRQQHVLLCAELVNEAFLRQSAFSQNDRYASAAKQAAMMGLIDRFIDLSADAVAAGIGVEDIGRLPVLRELRRMGEEIPNDEPERFDALGKALERAFMQLAARGAGDAG